MSKAKNLLYLIAFSVASLCAVGCTEGGSDDSLSGELILKASVDQMTIANGGTVDFTATIGDTDITKNALLKIYCIDEDKNFITLSNASFTAVKPGKYDFYAFCTTSTGGDAQSETISIEATFDIDEVDYQKRVLATQFTASSCGYCPIMTSALHHYAEQYGDDTIITASAHSGDIMSNSYSKYMINAMDVKGFPTLFVGSTDNDVAYNIGAQTPYTATLDSIAEAVEEIKAQGTATAIAMNSWESNGSITIEANVAVAKDGEYGIGAIIVEDGIKATQTSYVSLKELDLDDYDTSDHKNVVQAIFPAQNDLNMELAELDSHSANEFYHFNCSISKNGMTTLKSLAMCRVIVYTVNLESGFVDNVVQAPLGTGHAFDTKQ